jgi:hypothetical protein
MLSACLARLTLCESARPQATNATLIDGFTAGGICRRIGQVAIDISPDTRLPCSTLSRTAAWPMSVSGIVTDATARLVASTSLQVMQPISGVDW